MLLPQRCLACGTFGAALHDRCLDAPPAFAALCTPFRFAGAARRAVLEAKFRGVTRLLPPLARAAAAAVPAQWEVATLGAVVPVPLHAARERRRGHNQSEIVAREVAAALARPLDCSLLWRVRATPPQSGLSAEQRARNLDGAFAVAGEPPARLLLVDDVTTTGAGAAAGGRAARVRAGAGARGLARGRPVGRGWLESGGIWWNLVVRLRGGRVARCNCCSSRRRGLVAPARAA